MVIDVERTVALIVLLVFVAPFFSAVILMYAEDWVEDRIIGTRLFGDLQNQVSKLDHQVKSLQDKCKHMHILIMNQRELIMKQQELLNKVQFLPNIATGTNIQILKRNLIRVII